MTDQTIPAGLTRGEAQAVREWAERARDAQVQDATVAHAARVLLAVLPKRPTLANMTLKESGECQWLQADVEGRPNRAVLFDPVRTAHTARVMWDDGEITTELTSHVTPRPDLPRLEWPGTEKPDTSATAPPNTFTRSASRPSSCMSAMGTTANASFTS